MEEIQELNWVESSYPAVAGANLEMPGAHLCLRAEAVTTPKGAKSVGLSWTQWSSCWGHRLGCTLGIVK